MKREDVEVYKNAKKEVTDLANECQSLRFLLDIEQTKITFSCTHWNSIVGFQ